MDRQRLQQLLDLVANGDVSPTDALDRLKSLPFDDLGFAHVDHHRPLRKGYPEVIFCAGKTTEQVVQIAKNLVDHGAPTLATRADEATREALLGQFPQAEPNELARTVFVPGGQERQENGLVAVVSAGTSDLPVAQEAVVTARSMGARVESICDVGVAGIHRLLAYREQLDAARVLVVVAGMEGALPSVVGGLVEAPIIAVPTSIGYGASFNGIAALLAMLNSCAPGISVVNIDNGFGAGYSAAVINNLSCKDDS